MTYWVYMGVSQNYGYLFGVPIIRMMKYWGLYWGPPILENYHIGIMEENMETTIYGLGFIGFTLRIQLPGPKT